MFKNCWGDFRASLGLPGPRGGRRWTRLVPQYGFPLFSSKSGFWEAISWPFFVSRKKADIRLLKQFSPNPKRFTNKMVGVFVPEGPGFSNLSANLFREFPKLSMCLFVLMWTFILRPKPGTGRNTTTQTKQNPKRAGKTPAIKIRSKL